MNNNRAMVFGWLIFACLCVIISMTTCEKEAQTQRNDLATIMVEKGMTATEIRCVFKGEKC